ncbi:MAG: hypothetical protein LBQ44_01865 [Treponema sp.]|nr:hypothetical protein [Treponema sp.]
MFNFKISGIAGGTALALSLLLGLISGAGFTAVILRALIFGVLFFILFCLVFWILGQFIPELLNISGNDFDIIAPGSRVDMTVAGPIAGAFPRGDGEDVDNIEEPPRSGPAEVSQMSAGMDLGNQSGYNMKRDGSEGTPDFSPQGNSAGNGIHANSGSENSGGESPAAGTEIMPDFDALSGSFVSTPAGAAAEPEVYEAPSEPRRPLPRGGGKNDVMGDFNPKELALAIQTALKKDEKG